MSVSKESVEETARAMCDIHTGGGFFDHERTSEEFRDSYRRAARSILTTALPHLLAAKDAEIAALTKERDEARAKRDEWQRGLAAERRLSTTRADHAENGRREITALRKAIEQMRNTVRLHANAIETEVNLISSAALEKSGGAE